MRIRNLFVLAVVMCLGAGAWAGDPTSLVFSPPDSKTVFTNYSPDLQTDDAAGPPYYVPSIGWDVDGLCISNQGAGAEWCLHYWGDFDNSIYPLAYSAPTCAGVWWSNGAGEPVAPAGQQDEWLISPSVNCSTTTALNLSFWSVYTMNSYGAGATAHDYVQVSTDGGATWAAVGDLVHDAAFYFPGATGGPGGAGWNWNEYKITIPLSAYNGQPDVRFAFNYVATGAESRGVWMVDDVALKDGLAITLLTENMNGTWIVDPDYVVVLPPTDLNCAENGANVDLTWTNNDTYDSIEVYADDALLTTLAGGATSYTVVGVAKGGHCYTVCGLASGLSACTDPCCLIFGYDNVEVLWDFNADDGGFVVDGTGGWEWGAPTYGPCAGTADGNVWATDLAAEYPVDACWLLDSAPITIEMDKGGYLCFDHCYDIEGGYDGGVVWFTTDDYWYYNFEPLGGTDGQITADPGCVWVAGRYGFTGDSGGWVTDCWDFTDSMWLGQDVKIRFAFGSDSTVTAAGWMIDNITVYNNVGPEVYSCDYVITPLSGTVPFQTIHRVSLTNNLVGGQVWTRRLAVKINVVVGNGKSYSNWKSGSTQVAPGNTFVKQFPVNIPALATVIGNNTFTMLTQDVTPAPYNQPPYPASGTTCAKTNVVVAHAP